MAFELYTNHTGTIALKSEIRVDTYQANEKVGVDNVPYLDCSATLIEENGNIALAVINRHKENDIEAEINLKNFTPKQKCRVRYLNAPEVTAANDFDEPDNVVLRESEFTNTGEQFNYIFPAHSVTIIEIEPRDIK